MTLETKGKISKDIADRKKQMKERGDKMQEVVKDKEKIANVAKELKLTTTKEGVERMKTELKQAANKTREEFKKQNTNLEK